MTDAPTQNDVYQLIAPTITERIATMVLLTPEQIDIHQPLAQYGFDSIKAAELMAFIEDTLSIEIEPQDIPDLVTTEDVLQHLSARLAQDPTYPYP